MNANSEQASRVILIMLCCKKGVCVLTAIKLVAPGITCVRPHSEFSIFVFPFVEHGLADASETMFSKKV